MRAQGSEDDLPFIRRDHRCCTCLTILLPLYYVLIFFHFLASDGKGRRDDEMGASESPEVEVPMTMVRPVILGVD